MGVNMRRLKTFILTAAMSFIMSFTALAGQWNQSPGGWWYSYDDGTYAVNSWQWIDGNGDGVSECYYFDENGYCVLNSTTPDGQTVDANGALIVDGKIQTRTETETSANNNTTKTKNTAPQPTQSSSKTTDTSKNKENMVWVSQTGKKYHSKSSCSNMKNPSHMTESEAIGLGRTPCSKCY